MPYYACMPKSSGAPAWTLQNCRIEKADTAPEAVNKAFGRGNWPDNHPLAHYDADRWLTKNLGTRVAVLHSDKKRIALLCDPKGWVDPYAYRKVKA